jgi:hypothetical protein
MPAPVRGTCGEPESISENLSQPVDYVGLAHDGAMIRKTSRLPLRAAGGRNAFSYTAEAMQLLCAEGRCRTPDGVTAVPAVDHATASRLLHREESIEQRRRSDTQRWSAALKPPAIRIRRLLAAFLPQRHAFLSFQSRQGRSKMPARRMRPVERAPGCPRHF